MPLCFEERSQLGVAVAVDQGVYEGGGVDEGAYVAIAKKGAGKAAFIGDSSAVEDATPKYKNEETGRTKTTYDGYKEQDDAALLLQYVGGKENVKAITHCVTRMRFVLADTKKADYSSA